MIELATTPQPMAAPSAVANGSGASREDAPGFADLVTRQGSGRTSPAREAEAETMPNAQDDEATPIGDREAAPLETDFAGETPSEDVSSWPARGLHKVLATLFGDRGTDPRGDVEPTPRAIGEVVAGKDVASGDGTETDEEDGTETGLDTGTSDDADDAEASAGLAAVAVAMTPLSQPREQRPGATSTAKPADQPAGATPDAAKTEAGQNQTAQDEGAQSGGERRGETAADAGKARIAAPEAGDLKVRVIGETVIPTPGPLQNQRTIADLVATIASDGEWTGAMERATASRSEAASTPVGPVRDLKIQLNPAELGSVEARLRIVGEQLSVEIRVESGEAFRRLSSERDAIISALRGLGFAVDDITIQQQQPTSAQAQGGGAGRQNDTSGGLSQGTGRDQHGEGHAAGNRPPDGEQGGRNGDALTSATRSPGGGLYI